MPEPELTVPRSEPAADLSADALQAAVQAAAELARLVDTTNVRRLTVAVGGVTIDVEGGGATPTVLAPATDATVATVAPAAALAAVPAPLVAVAEAAAAPPDPARTHVRAPLVGVFYASPGPNEAPFVTPGDRVEKGQQVAIVEAMKMMNAIEAPCAGIVETVHAEVGEVVEYDQTLLTITADR